MGRLLSFIVLAFFVVLVPLGSWYYLREGLNYRKQALSDLIIKDSIRSDVDSLGLLLNKTTVFSLQSLPSGDSTLFKLQDQFQKVENFQIISLDTLAPYLHLPSGYANKFLSKYADKSFVLVDDKRYVRNAYGSSVEDIKKLVEHIAITIPRVKEADIKMKQ
jgi:hypothetical protein